MGLLGRQETAQSIAAPKRGKGSKEIQMVGGFYACVVL